MITLIHVFMETDSIKVIEKEKVITYKLLKALF